MFEKLGKCLASKLFDDKKVEMRQNQKKTCKRSDHRTTAYHTKRKNMLLDFS
jgi:hypothetical protein